ncbi:hypothetical protein D3C71_1950460 [compost metagenome]
MPAGGVDHQHQIDAVHDTGDLREQRIRKEDDTVRIDALEQRTDFGMIVVPL